MQYKQGIKAVEWTYAVAKRRGAYGKEKRGAKRSGAACDWKCGRSGLPACVDGNRVCAGAEPGVIGQGSIPTASLCANALAAFAGSLIAARGFSQRRLLSTLACTAGYLLVLLLGNLLFVSAPPDGVLWVAAPALAASTLACLLVSGKPKRGRRRR